MRLLLVLTLASIAVPAAADVIPGVGDTPMIDAMLQKEQRDQQRRLDKPAGSPRTISSHTGVLLITKADGTNLIIKPGDAAPALNPGDEVEVQSGECVLTFKNSRGKVFSEVKAGAGSAFVVALDGRSIEITDGTVLVSSGGKFLSFSKGDSVATAPPFSVATTGAASGSAFSSTGSSNAKQEVLSSVSPSAP